MYTVLIGVNKTGVVHVYIEAKKGVTWYGWVKRCTHKLTQPCMANKRAAVQFCLRVSLVTSRQCATDGN